MNNFYKGGRELAYLKGLSHYAVQQKTTAIRQHLQMQVQAARLANAIMFIDPITLLRKLWKTKAILLIVIALLHMFSLSAQTPRKDSGADGLKDVKELRVGDYVPKDFWDQTVKIYHQGDTGLIKLSRYKGKSLLIDFWATWCGYCVQGFPKLVDIQNKYNNHINVLLVNGADTKDTYTKIHTMPDVTLREHNLSSVYLDEYFTKLFPHRLIPHYVWINPKGKVVGITFREFVEEDMVKFFIKRNIKYETSN